MICPLFHYMVGWGDLHCIVDDRKLHLCMVLACLHFHGVLYVQDSVSWCQLVRDVEKSPWVG
jgi:hypothetical protein